jgi:hypothetical protein
VQPGGCFESLSLEALHQPADVVMIALQVI